MYKEMYHLLHFSSLRIETCVIDKSLPYSFKNWRYIVKFHFQSKNSRLGGKIPWLGYLHPHPKNEDKEEEYVSYTKFSSMIFKRIMILLEILFIIK